MHFGLRKFRHSNSSVYWCNQQTRRRSACGLHLRRSSCHGLMHKFIIRWSTVTLQLHYFELFWTCTSCYYCYDTLLLLVTPLSVHHYRPHRYAPVNSPVLTGGQARSSVDNCFAIDYFELSITFVSTQGSFMRVPQ